MRHLFNPLLAAVIVLAAVALDAPAVDAQAKRSTPVDKPGRVVPNQCPQGIRPRREIRKISAEERKVFLDAVRQLQYGPSPTRYDAYSLQHMNANTYAHNTPIFFPWHRRYLREFEIDLQNINPDIMVPYWDWTLDSQAPHTSDIFKNDYFGGNGKDNDGCVQDGPFASWQPAYPRRDCLRRGFNNGKRIKSFYSPEAIQYMISSKPRYNDFRLAIEIGPHGDVHNAIGGHMLYMHSPNDPLFFMHHAMVDKIWDQWQ
ncbi:hypothetical protein THASP1DRAFT_14106, partial [Thamnocephalis sphaerospora]